MKTFVPVLFSIVMSATASTVFGQAQNIEDFARRDYFEGVPYEEVALLDSATAVPILLKMLKDPSQEEYWPNVVVILGMLGDDLAVDPLIRFLEQSKAENLSHGRLEKPWRMRVGCDSIRCGVQRRGAHGGSSGLV